MPPPSIESVYWAEICVDNRCAKLVRLLLTAVPIWKRSLQRGNAPHRPERATKLLPRWAIFPSTTNNTETHTMATSPQSLLSNTAPEGQIVGITGPNPTFRTNISSATKLRLNREMVLEMLAGGACVEQRLANLGFKSDEFQGIADLSPEIVRVLLDIAAGLDANRSELIAKAAKEGHIDIVKLVLAAGANPEAKPVYPCAMQPILS